MIEVAEFFDFLTRRVKEILMSPFLKTLLMGLATVSWSAIVTWFHGQDPTANVFSVNFHDLWLAIGSSLVPALIAYFMRPPHLPAEPPAEPPAQ